MSEKEVGQNNPLSTTQAQLEVTRTTLSALITSREASARQYPAVIGEILNGVVFATLTRPVLRLVKREQPRTNVSINNRIAGISGSNPVLSLNSLRVGDAVSIHHRSEEWYVSTTLDDEHYKQKLQGLSEEQLVWEGQDKCPTLEKRSAKRRFETFFQLSPTESTPWGVPGRMKDGQNLLSKRVLDWIARRGGQDIQSALKRNLPSSEEWGDGPFCYGLVPLSNGGSSFSPIAIPIDEHKTLLEAWSVLLRTVAAERPHTNSDTDEIRFNFGESATSEDHAENHHGSSTTTNAYDAGTQADTALAHHVAKTNANSISLHAGEQSGLLNKNAVNHSALSPRLRALIQSFQLPIPTQQLNENPGLLALCAWSESDNPGLRSRATDFLLMTLADGTPVRNADEMRPAWAQWHKETDPIARTCTIVKSGEEPAAIRALVGKFSPDPTESAAMVDQLLLRWRRDLIQKHNLSVAEKPVPPLLPLREVRKAFRQRNIRCSDLWVERMMLALYSAREMGMLLVLKGNRAHAKSIFTSLLEDMFEEATSTAVRISPRRAQLLGRMSRERNLYTLSELSKAIRKAGHQYRYSDPGQYSPSFIYIEDINEYAKLDGLSLLLQQGYYGEGERLYSQDDNERFISEHRLLESLPDLSEDQQQRRNELERFFSPEMTGGRSLEASWRLHISHNTHILGFLDTQHVGRSLELLKRSLVLDVPEGQPGELTLSVSQNQRSTAPTSGLKGSNLWRQEGLRDQNRMIRPHFNWQHFPITKGALFNLLTDLQECNIQLNDILAQQIAFILGVAESWEIPDSIVLASHIAHLLILPKIRCTGKVLQRAIETAQRRENIAPDLRSSLTKLHELSLKSPRQIMHGAL